MEAPGVAFSQQRFQKFARSRAFPVKLLMLCTFDVFIDFARFLSNTPESTEFVETLWRRREPIPVARPANECVRRNASLFAEDCGWC